MKHTPGPWKIVTERGGVTYIKQGERYLSTLQIDPDCCTECSRYLRLIAAAPEMAKLLQIAADNGDVAVRARALLARIDGGE